MSEREPLPRARERLLPPFLSQTFKELGLEPPNAQVLHRAQVVVNTLNSRFDQSSIPLKGIHQPQELLTVLPEIVCQIAECVDKEFLYPHLWHIVSHAGRHLQTADWISSRVGNLLGVLGEDEKSGWLADCLRIAVYLHDLGNWGGRSHHAEVSGIAAWEWLSQSTALQEDARRIIAHADATHDKAPLHLLDRENRVRSHMFEIREDGILGEAGDDATSAYYTVAALLFLGDKLDVGRLIPEDWLLWQRFSTAFGTGRNIHYAQANFEGVEGIHLSDNDLLVGLKTNPRVFFFEAAATIPFDDPRQGVLGDLLTWIEDGPTELLSESLYQAIQDGLSGGSTPSNLLATAFRERKPFSQALAMVHLFDEFTWQVGSELREAYAKLWDKCARLLEGTTGRPTHVVIRTDWPFDNIIYSTDKKWKEPPCPRNRRDDAYRSLRPL